MTNIYLQEKKKRENRKDYKDNVLFGMIGGTLLASISFLQFLGSAKGWDILWAAVFVFGILLFMAALFAASLVEPVKKGFTNVGNRFGNLIFKMLLIVMYFIFIIPAGKFMNKERYEFYSWEKEPPENTKGFIDRKEIYGDYETADSGRITLYRVIGFFVERKQFIMLPALIILLVLGIVLFFLSSTVVAPFIYTLF